MLPEIVYFRAAMVLDESMADRDAAGVMLDRILARYRNDDVAFDVTEPSRLTRGWEDVGGMAGVNQIAADNAIRIRTLARLAHWRAEAGDHAQAAQVRSRIRHFMFSHGMPFGYESLHFWTERTGASHTGNGYWQMVQLNRDRNLYPGTINLIHDGELVDASTGPMHGFHKWQGPRRFWLAPPG